MKFSASRFLGVVLALGASTAYAQNPVTGAALNPNPGAISVPATGPSAGMAVYNVRAFGATGNGLTIDSDAVNKAIDAAAANGGGTVYFPAGYYLCFSIHLKTNISLYLDQGSWIVAADTPPEIVALQPRGRGNGGGGRGNGGGGFGGGGQGPAAADATGTGAGGTGAQSPDAAGAAGTGGGGFGGGGGRGGNTAAPRYRGQTQAEPAPLAPNQIANAADFGQPIQPSAIQDFLAKVPPGAHMYDVIEDNVWSKLPAWRRPANAGAPAPDNADPDSLVTEQYQDFGHCFWHNSLIWGENITNVSILGPGMIYGRGLSRGDGPTNLGGGNKSISLKNCRNVILKDFTVWQGGWFCLLATGVDNFTISNLKIDTNRDGFDIDCCKNVHISDCTINSPQDDGIVLKSSFALGYNRSTDNVTITNCQVSGYVTGTLLDGTYQPYGRNVDGGGAGTGRIKFGTESNGGFKNITISNCVFNHCRGLALESADGAVIEDITISNIAMRDIVNAPIYIRLGHRLRGPVGTQVGVIRRVNINNITASNVAAGAAIMILGTPERPVQDVRLSDIRIDYQGGAPAEWAQLDPPEDESMFYPEPGRMGNMPGYGMFARHVNGLSLRNVEFSVAKPDLRPAVVLDDVQDISFDHFKAQIDDAVPQFMLWNTRDFTLEHVTGIADKHIDKMDEGSVAH